MVNRPLHICQITTVHPWNDIRIFQRQCRGLVERGYRVTLVAPVEKPMCVEGVQVVPTDLRGKIARLIRVPKLLRRLRDIGADVYHFHDPELLPWMFLWQCTHPSSRVVYDVHEYYPETLVDSNYFHWRPINRMMSRIVLTMEPIMARRLCGVIGVTAPIAQRFAGGRARVAVVRNLARLDSITNLLEPPPSNEENSQELNGLPADQLIVIGGTVDRGRCMEELIEAMGILKERGIEIFLLCLGKPYPPELSDVLLAAAKHRGIEDMVEFREQLPFALYQRCVAQSRLGMVLYAPGRNNSMGVPNRLYEFMAQSVPVIASDMPELAHVVKDADCGLLVNSSPASLAQAMEYLLTHREEAARLGANGRRAVESIYNWECEVDVLTGYYLRLMEDTPTPRPSLRKPNVGNSVQADAARKLPNNESAQ